MIVGIVSPPVVGRLYKFFTQASRPLGVGPSGVYYLGACLFLASFAILRTAEDTAGPPAAEGAPALAGTKNGTKVEQA